MHWEGSREREREGGYCRQLATAYKSDTDMHISSQLALFSCPAK